jgi:RNA polymerase sigma factor (TIGR02999 family)
MADGPIALTQLLHSWQQGDQRASELLAEAVYDELRQVAARRLASERRDHTLQPTALVNETFVRLLDAGIPWRDRVHFFAVAARAMRRILVEHARARNRAKRGSGAVRVTFDGVHSATPEMSIEILALHDALDALAQLDPDQARVIELHYFAGMTLEEIALAVGRSRSSVHRLVRSGEAWLSVRLGDRGAPA